MYIFGVGADSIDKKLLLFPFEYYATERESNFTINQWKLKQ